MLVAPHQFSIEEYHAMVEKGMLAPDARVELLEGIIVDMAPIGPFHVGVTAELSRLFTLAGPDKWLVMTQMPVRLNDGTELQPDIMLVPLDFTEFKRRTVTPEDVRLLIEVSDTSVRYDRERKIPLYAAAQIPEVWIVNLDDHFVEVHRTPEKGSYTHVQQVRPGEFATPLAFPDVRVNVAQLLHRAN
jgi:Uma2 family endonuclease